MQREVAYILVKYEVELLSRCVPWEIVTLLDRTCDLKLSVIYISENNFCWRYKIEDFWLNKFNCQEDSLVKVSVSFWTLRSWEYPVPVHKLWSLNSEWFSKKGLTILTYFGSLLLISRNQSTDLDSKSMEWFLHNYNTGLK